MRKAVLGALLGAGLLIAVASALEQPSAVFAQRPAVRSEVGGEAGMIALQSTSADNGQLITLVDTRQRVMAVYRIEPANGHIKLMSVRNLQWDLQMSQLNGESPLPQEIQSLLQSR